MMRIPSLEKVVAETLTAIEKSKKEIQYIANNARTEKERLQEELAVIQNELMTTIEQVDHLEELEKAARLHLLKVSKEFTKYTEKDAHLAYDRARDLQVQLGSLREREKQLNLRRNELERNLKKMRLTMHKAEKLNTQVGVVFDYLGGNLKNINDQLTVVMQRRHLASEIIRAQEEERRRVAREIHDGPAQSMANVILRAEVCEKLLVLDPKAVRKELGEFKGMVRKSLQDVRRIIFDLRPMALDDLGLLPALNRYLETLKERYNIEMEMALSSSGVQQRLAPPIEVAIYRVVQEALQNTIKHAEASCAKIFLHNEPQRLVVKITDDGKGFPVEEFMQNPQRDSYGLLGMKERLEILGGQLMINSRPGEGTEILAILPLDV
jgi:two-component system sensor histidine kinase DegS